MDLAGKSNREFKKKKKAGLDFWMKQTCTLGILWNTVVWNYLEKHTKQSSYIREYC